MNLLFNPNEPVYVALMKFKLIVIQLTFQLQQIMHWIEGRRILNMSAGQRQAWNHVNFYKKFDTHSHSHLTWDYEKVHRTTIIDPMWFVMLCKILTCFIYKIIKQYERRIKHFIKHGSRLFPGNLFFVSFSSQVPYFLYMYVTPTPLLIFNFC